MHRADVLGQERRDERTTDRAGRPADGDDAEQPLALFTGEQVGHERPEHAGHHQVDDAEPYIKGIADLDVLRPALRHRHQHDVKHQQVQRDEPVEPRDERAARKAGRHPRENRRGEQRGDRGSRPQPGQFVEVAADSHFIPERAQQVVTEEHEEEVRGRQHHRAALAGLEHHEFPRG
jgi:hypothetical protein